MPTTNAGTIEQALRRSRGLLIGVAVFSGVINVLALTGAIYMLQVYDRVLPSRSIPTLIALTLVMAVLFSASGLLDYCRTRLMSRVGLRIDTQLREKVFAAVQLLPLQTRNGQQGLQSIRDLDQIRSFLSGLGPTALFDMPWVPIYLLVIFLLHPLLGYFSVAGALLLIVMTILTERRSSGPMLAATKSGAQRMAFGETTRRNADIIRAMGLGPQAQRRWAELNTTYVTDQLHAADAVGGMGAASKVVRFLLQSGILGLGAYLVILNEVSPGTIIAGSIIMSRALAPIETAIAHWRSFVGARQSRRRLIALFQTLEQDDQKRVTLPTPQHSLTIEGLSVAPPGETQPVIRNISFSLKAGDGLGIIGPSGSGKSTLAKALVGVWRPMRMGGSVRLDGAALDQWAPDDLGRHIGYLPQDIELFDGTVATNIARLDPDAPSEAIVAAARTAGAHDLIVSLPDGYQTQLRDGGTGVSAGQRQRLALARALYGDPFLVVLDEPNSNLDEAGDSALTGAIRAVRARGGIVIVIAHRPSALAGVDRVLVMKDGACVAMKPTEEIVPPVRPPVPTPRTAAAPSGPMVVRVVPDDKSGTPR